MCDVHKLDGRPLNSGSGERDARFKVGDYEIFFVDVKRIPTKGRPRGATKFYIAGGLNVLMGLNDVTDKEASMCGPRVWTGGCKKLITV